jgi:hypothetical protein
MCVRAHVREPHHTPLQGKELAEKLLNKTMECNIKLIKIIAGAKASGKYAPKFLQDD